MFNYRTHDTKKYQLGNQNMGFMGQIGPNMGQNMGFMDFMGRVDTLCVAAQHVGCGMSNRICIRIALSINNSIRISIRI